MVSYPVSPVQLHELPDRWGWLPLKPYSIGSRFQSQSEQIKFNVHLLGVASYMEVDVACGIRG